MTRKCRCPAPFVRSSHCCEFLTSARIRLRFAMSQSTTILFFLTTSPQHVVDTAAGEGDDELHGAGGERGLGSGGTRNERRKDGSDPCRDDSAHSRSLPLGCRLAAAVRVGSVRRRLVGSGPSRGAPTRPRRPDSCRRRYWH